MLVTGTAQYFLVYQDVSLSTIHTRKYVISRYLVRVMTTKRDGYGLNDLFSSEHAKNSKKRAEGQRWVDRRWSLRAEGG